MGDYYTDPSNAPYNEPSFAQERAAAQQQQQEWAQQSFQQSMAEQTARQVEADRLRFTHPGGPSDISGASTTASGAFDPKGIAAAYKTRFGIVLGILIGLLWGVASGGIVNIILGIVIATFLCTITASRGLLGVVAGGILGILVGTQTHGNAGVDITDIVWKAVIGIVLGFILERIVTGMMVRRITRAS